MKASLFYGAGVTHGPVRMVVEEVPTPKPGVGEVLVKVAACGVCRRATDLPGVLRLVGKGLIDLNKVVSHRFKLDEINEAYLRLDMEEMLRGIVIP